MRNQPHVSELALSILCAVLATAASQLTGRTGVECPLFFPSAVQRIQRGAWG
jgi:hypothetical protein